MCRHKQSINTPKLCSVLSTKKLTPKTIAEQHNIFCNDRRMGDRYIEVVEAYQLDTVVWERPCRQVMPSHRTGTICSKSGTPIPQLPHFQGFVEQEGKGRGGHACSLPEKNMTKT
jgi:hypothetical protein